MAVIPYIPFYVSDYLADAAHLTTEEHGAYLLLIFNYWQRGESLPDDDLKLSRIVKLSEKKFQKVKKNILEFFSKVDDRWVHYRIEDELSFVREKSTKSRVAGIISGQKRKENKKEINERPFNVRSTDVERTLNHTDTDTYTDINTKESKKKKSLIPVSDDVKKVFDCWVLTMHKTGAILGSSRKLIIEKAMKLGFTTENLCKAIFGCSVTPWNCGDNDERKKFIELKLILRDEEQIERFMSNADNPPLPRSINKTKSNNDFVIQQAIEKRRSLQNE